MSFKQLALIEPLNRAVSELGYTNPTSIQFKAIPLILNGHDLLGSAQTGTGKTASFVLPILQKASQQTQTSRNRAKVLILTPTRELAIQVHESIIQYGKYLTLRSAVIYGGVKSHNQIKQLDSGLEILVATPGRLLDLYQQGAVKFDEIDTLVLDEADRMLDMGFIHDIKKIIKLLPLKRQNLLFSATFTPEVRTLARNILNKAVEIDIAPRNTAVKTIKQTVYSVDRNHKLALLSHLLHKNNWGQTLVFSRTKHGANKLVKQLAESQIYSVAIHGNKSQAQRTKALADFKSGKVQTLIATDIAARGIDIEKLACVVNFDLPHVPEDYVHRIGRTGRAGASGLAVSLVSTEEIKLLLSIEKLINQKLERIKIKDFEFLHNFSDLVSAKIQKFAPPKAGYKGNISRKSRAAFNKSA